jgi:hypothetical protein
MNEKGRGDLGSRALSVLVVRPYSNFIASEGQVSAAA